MDAGDEAMRFAAQKSKKVHKKKSTLPPPVSTAPSRPECRVAAPNKCGRIVGPKERSYQLKVEAARAVGNRETLLMQLNAVVLHWPQQKNSRAESGILAATPARSRAATADQLLLDLAVELRKAGLYCVEKIVAWVLHESADATSPLPFFWNGKDYLLKMADDLDFVAETLGVNAYVPRKLIVIPFAQHTL